MHVNHGYAFCYASLCQNSLGDLEAYKSVTGCCRQERHIKGVVTCIVHATHQVKQFVTYQCSLV